MSSSALQTLYTSGEVTLYRYLNQVNKIPSLTAEEEDMLARDYINDKDIRAAQKLVASYLKLVAKVAMRYKNYGLSLIDVISEGNLGLMQAVKKFNPDMGYRLSTYAMWWIKASIQDYILKSWSLVKIGTTAAQKKLFFSLNKAKNRIMGAAGRSLSKNDYVQIAHDLGVEEKDIHEMDQRMSRDVSLNQPSINAEDGTDMIDYVQESRPNQELTIVHASDMTVKKRALAEALHSLPERDKYVLYARKLSNNPKTLESLSLELNVSKERIRQIETRAFEKVQKYVLAKYSA